MAYLAEDVNYQEAFVIDNGSGVLKSGRGGTEQPHTVIPACVGYPKHERVIFDGKMQDDEVTCGNAALANKGLLRLKYPTRHGVIEDWDAMVGLWDHLYKDIDMDPSSHPVLVTEAPLNPMQNRKLLAERFFDRFNVPAIYIANQAVLSLYASGRKTGCVLDSGHGVTHCVPVVDGFEVKHAVSRMDVAGVDVNEYLNVLLQQSGINFHTSAEMEIVRDIKETCCRVSLSKNHDEGLHENNQGTRYKLPDGNTIRIIEPQWVAPEILFDPTRIGLEYPGIPGLIENSIQRCDIDLRKQLYESILLSGGSTTFPGFGDRLLHELREKAQEKKQDIKLKIFAPANRKIATWMGGSILTALRNFESSWITRSDYFEHGTNVLFRNMVAN